MLKCTYLNFESKIFLHVFDNHYKEWELDAKGFLAISRTSDVRGAIINIIAHVYIITVYYITTHLTLVPQISKTNDPISLSVILLM